MWDAYGYNAEDYDAGTGMSYLRARYLSIEVGAFITEDTVKGNIFIPGSYNLYMYVEGNPVRWRDPSGNNKCDPVRIFTLLNAADLNKVTVKVLYKIKDGKIAYIIFDSKEFSEQAKYQKNIVKNEGLLVIMLPANTRKAFEDAWNGMDDTEGIEKVIIIMHSNRGVSLIMEEGSGTEALSVDGKNKVGNPIGNIHDLQKKDIDELYLYACNAGITDVVVENVAQAFGASGTIGTVYAYDGNVGFGLWKIRDITGNYGPRLSIDQKSFREILEENKETLHRNGIFKRIPKGEIEYRFSEASK
jgi:RHS repeat-associated protein